MSNHLIAEANRHAKALPKMTLPTTKANGRDLAWYIAECIDLKKQLEMECAAKREHLRIACEEINELKVKAGFYEREIARLRADGYRLDWLEANLYTLYASGLRCNESPAVEIAARSGLFKAESIRAAIDAARKEAQP